MQIRYVRSKERLAGIAVLLVMAIGSVAETPYCASRWSSDGSVVVKPRVDSHAAKTATMPACQSLNDAVPMPRQSAPSDAGDTVHEADAWKGGFSYDREEAAA